MSADVVVIGGGVIGGAAALALARRGARVHLIERAHLGAEASSAAAGILGAHAEAHDAGPLTQLCLRSLALYPAWSAALVEASGIDTGFRPCGALRVFFDEAALHEQSRAATAAFGAAAITLDAAALQAREPQLATNLAGALRFPADARVDPPALVRALEAAVRRAGVHISHGNVARIVIAPDRTSIATPSDLAGSPARATAGSPARATAGSPARDPAGSPARATGVVLDSGETIAAGAVVVTAGAWSGLPGSGLVAPVIEPIRGQMVELRAPATRLDQVVFGPAAYLSPRDDGRLLVGSTQERAGFHKAVTVAGLRALLDGAVALVPALAAAEIGRTWAGLRPATPDGGPLLGHGHARGLVIATGHFRNGILLAPISGEIVADLILGGGPELDLGPFAPGRFAAVQP